MPEPDRVRFVYVVPGTVLVLVKFHEPIAEMVFNDRVPLLNVMVPELLIALDTVRFWLATNVNVPEALLTVRLTHVTEPAVV